MEEIVGLGNATDVWRGWIGQGSLHLSLSGGAGRPRPRRAHHHVSAARRRTGRQRRLDVGLGGRRRRDAQAMRRSRAGGHIPAPPICRGTSARCTFAIRMATCSGSAGDSSLKGRKREPKDVWVGFKLEPPILRVPHPSVSLIAIYRQLSDCSRVTGRPSTSPKPVSA